VPTIVTNIEGGEQRWPQWSCKFVLWRSEWFHCIRWCW